MEAGPGVGTAEAFMSDQPFSPISTALRDVLAALAMPEELFLRTVKIEHFQGSGKGGQKRNRVYSAVRATHSLTGLATTAESYREVGMNEKDAVRKLRIALAVKSAEDAAGTALDNLIPLRDGAALSNTAFPRFRLPVNEKHWDYPCIIATALCVFKASEGDLRKAADFLGCSSSALVRLFKEEGQAWAFVQHLRRDAALHPLK